MAEVDKTMILPIIPILLFGLSIGLIIIDILVWLILKLGKNIELKSATKQFKKEIKEKTNGRKA
jgi:hypothetical protein